MRLVSVKLSSWERFSESFIVGLKSGGGRCEEVEFYGTTLKENKEGIEVLRRRLNWEKTTRDGGFKLRMRI